MDNSRPIESLADVNPVYKRRKELQTLIRPLSISEPEARDVERFIAAGGPKGLLAVPLPSEDVYPSADPRELWDLWQHARHPSDRNRPPLVRPPQNMGLVNQSLHDLLPYRTKAAYRIVREIARQLGWLGEDETLAEVMDVGHVNRWQEPLADIKGKRGRPHGMGVTPISNRLKCLLEDPLSVRLTIEPPSAPKDADFEVYNPEIIDHDPLLHHWIKLFRIISDQLGIEGGAPLDPHAGIYGLAGLLDPALVRLAWPGRSVLLAWERLLVEQTLDLIVHAGPLYAKDELFKLHGLQVHEIQSLLKIARIASKTYTEGDIEEHRSIMVLRLESLLERAKEALDTRSEMHAIKQLSIILGLSKADPEDAVEDFIATAKKVTNEASNTGHSEQYPYGELPGLSDPHVL